MSLKRKEHPDAKSLADAAGGAKVSLSAAFNQKKYRLIEVTDDIIATLQTGGTRLVGDDDNDVVLCTPDKTFEIKKVETSNAVCMVPPVPNGAPMQFTIEAIKDDFFELRLIPARLDRLKALLKSSEYRGQSEEGRFLPNTLLTRSQLEERVQASVAELEEALTALGAIDFNGFVRVISLEIIKDSIKQLLDIILECGWKLDSICMTKCMEYLPEVDPLLLHQALGSVGSLQAGGSRDGDVWVLDERRVAAWSAEIIMSNGRKENKYKFPETDFLQEWEAQTPGSGARNITALEGIAVKDGTHYIYLSVKNMTSSAAGRFSELFAAKAKWTADELHPYVLELFGKTGQPKTADELLLLHTRRVDNYYSSK